MSFYLCADVYPSLPPVPLFNDLNDYWSAQTPLAGVQVPKNGTTIQVVNTDTLGNFMEVIVRPSR